jgi:hypothetical protein
MNVPVTEPILVARIRRTLRKAGEDLHRATYEQQRAKGLGKYYLIDSKGIIEKNVHIKILGRELNLLGPWETISE